MLSAATTWAVRCANSFGADRALRMLQLGSASLFSLGHGRNDAQKVMDIIAGLLINQGKLGRQFHVPLWVMMCCRAAMTLGMLIGGWRILHTMGSKITALKPFQGFTAGLDAAVTIFIAIAMGTPISTAHPIAGVIAGVGPIRIHSAVRRSIACEIVFARALTLPAAAAVSEVTYVVVPFVA